MPNTETATPLADALEAAELPDLDACESCDEPSDNLTAVQPAGQLLCWVCFCRGTGHTVVR